MHHICSACLPHMKGKCGHCRGPITDKKRNKVPDPPSSAFGRDDKDSVKADSLLLHVVEPHTSNLM